MILLDTNVISEVMNLQPSPAVKAWIDARDPDELWTCTIVVAEIFAGLDLMPPGKRQRQLREKAESMFSVLFAGRICGFDYAAAAAFGAIFSARQANGRPIDQMDALIASIALTNDATLATRNIRDFEQTGIRLTNPWQTV